HQPHAQDAPDHGRRDEGRRLGEARAVGRPCRHAGSGLRHAEPRANAGARKEDAGWNAWRNARSSAVDARAATKVSRPAWSRRPQAARPAWGEEEMMQALTRRVGKGARESVPQRDAEPAPLPTLQGLCN